MLRALFTCLVCLAAFLSVSAQCIDPKFVFFYKDWDYEEEISSCPTFTFTYDAGEWTRLSIMRYPIDIKLAPPETLIYKEKVDSAIRAYASEEFRSRLFFRDVDIVFPDSFERFAPMGIKNRNCKAKFNFYYEFRADTVARHFIPILLDADGNLLHDLGIPSKKEYRPIDTNFTHCSLIKIARKAEPRMNDIRQIHFEYDKETKKYYWRLYMPFKEDRKGNNFFEAIIDAADLSKVTVRKGHEMRIHHGYRF